jgi:hypothetical protein
MRGEGGSKSNESGVAILHAVLFEDQPRYNFSIQSGVIHFLWYTSYCLGMSTQIRYDRTLLV